MLYILTGDDNYSRQQALAEIKAGLGDQAMLATNTTVLEGQRLTVNELIATSSTAPFLAEKRLVIVNGLLARFQPKEKPAVRKGAGNNSSRQSEVQPFVEAISGIPESTVLVLVEDGLKGHTPLLTGLTGQAKVRTFPPLKPPRLREWVQAQVKAEQSSISSGAVDALVRLVGSDLWTMTSEIKKLVLFAAGRRIEEQDVSEVVSLAREADIFALVDAVVESRPGAAEQFLTRLLQAGETPANILRMLARQARLMVLAQEFQAQGMPRAVISVKLGIPSEFILQKTLEQAEHYPLERLKRMYDKLLEADLAIKTGKYPDELALNILVAELCVKQEA